MLRKGMHVLAVVSAQGVSRNRAAACGPLERGSPSVAAWCKRRMEVGMKPQVGVLRL
jgi:hypothetical protein